MLEEVRCVGAWWGSEDLWKGWGSQGVLKLGVEVLLLWWCLASAWRQPLLKMRNGNDFCLFEGECWWRSGMVSLVQDAVCVSLVVAIFRLFTKKAIFSFLLLNYKIQNNNVNLVQICLIAISYCKIRNSVSTVWYTILYLTLIMICNYFFGNYSK